MLWVKAFHLITMVTWFSGLFYLPRLFVYHAMSEDKTSQERFKIMERKLYHGIITPSAVITLFLGTWLLYAYAWELYKTALWLHLKIGLILILLSYQFYCDYLRRQFQRDKNQHGHIFYRWLNEFPVLLLIGIVCLAVLKPF